jgi:hypothetical protein
MKTAAGRCLRRLWPPAGEVHHQQPSGARVIGMRLSKSGGEWGRQPAMTKAEYLAFAVSLR